MKLPVCVASSLREIPFLLIMLSMLSGCGEDKTAMHATSWGTLPPGASDISYYERADGRGGHVDFSISESDLQAWVPTLAIGSPAEITSPVKVKRITGVTTGGPSVINVAVHSGFVAEQRFPNHGGTQVVFDRTGKRGYLWYSAN